MRIYNMANLQQKLLKDELGESEEPRFIKSLFWNL